ncbi:hypothetical protein J5N97_026403 [Dioscorea zingiberensis]|uniref:Uncharacterized protein n=1 Tax=Dioscorea zingiberensis TaxID=325984 RepID=A0A9D5H6R4_9LILI|nr:hypothetical protein J5N97_026403 [Dioscorea zingiberensis]
MDLVSLSCALPLPIYPSNSDSDNFDHNLFTDPDPSPSPSPPRYLCGPSPTPRSAIDAIPTIEISDSSLVFAVCKDDLPLRSSVRHCPYYQSQGWTWRSSLEKRTQGE